MGVVGDYWATSVLWTDKASKLTAIPSWHNCPRNSFSGSGGDPDARWVCPSGIAAACRTMEPNAIEIGSRAIVFEMLLGSAWSAEPRGVRASSDRNSWRCESPAEFSSAARERPIVAHVLTRTVHHHDREAGRKRSC